MRVISHAVSCHLISCSLLQLNFKSSIQPLLRDHRGLLSHICFTGALTSLVFTPPATLQSVIPAWAPFCCRGTPGSVETAPGPPPSAGSEEHRPSPAAAASLAPSCRLLERPWPSQMPSKSRAEQMYLYLDMICTVAQGADLLVTGRLGEKSEGRTRCSDLLTPLERLTYFCSGSLASTPSGDVLCRCTVQKI